MLTDDAVGDVTEPPVQVVTGLDPAGTVTPAGRLSVVEMPDSGWPVGL